ncbi:hypothetical protein ACFQJD_05020 [Haloplanus sp. GCM10025708]|uniref:DUF7289 family protein n=1 Tax=Haloferacaceae TaxID=1644056 RepID=UPI003613C02D
MTRLRARGRQLLTDRSAQSEVVGYALVIALTLVAVTSVLVFGASALDDTRLQSEMDRAEQQMTLLDSRVSTVALGEADQQSISVPTSSGQYEVDSTAGSVEITHINYDGSGSNATILPETDLGAVVYRSGDRSIAYQGGGVWRSDSTGDSRLVSPPEFHYRQATLTFPIIVVNGNVAGSGETRLRFTQTASSVPVYPANETYPNGDEFENPVEHGRVQATIQSEYAEGWAAYFRSRTSGNVTMVDDETVRVELVTTGTRGDFRMPAETQSISLRGMDSGHSLTDFSFTLRPQDTESSSFSNLDWSFYATQGDREFEINIEASANDCAEDVALAIYYSEDGGDTHQGWYDPDAFQTTCGEVNGKPADGDEIWVNVDLVPPNGSHTMSYQGVKKDLVHHKRGTNNLVSGASFTQHPADPGTSYTSGDSEDLALITRHYFAMLGPDIDLAVADRNNAGISETASSGYVYYNGSGKVITYLHVTQNNVTASTN